MELPSVRVFQLPFKGRPQESNLDHPVQSWVCSRYTKPFAAPSLRVLHERRGRDSNPQGLLTRTSLPTRLLAIRVLSMTAVCYYAKGHPRRAEGWNHVIPPPTPLARATSVSICPSRSARVGPMKGLRVSERRGYPLLRRWLLLSQRSAVAAGGAGGIRTHVRYRFTTCDTTIPSYCWASLPSFRLSARIHGAPPSLFLGVMLRCPFGFQRWASPLSPSDGGESSIGQDGLCLGNDVVVVCVW